MKIPPQAFTYEYPGQASQLRTPIKICRPNETDGNKIFEVQAIWDTGAMRSMITKAFVAKLGLLPSGKTSVKGVNDALGGVKADTYLIDLILPNQVRFQAIRVIECEELSHEGVCAMLIGMDVITHGDLAITNVGGKTVFSFRMPPQEKIDFMKLHNNHFGKPQGPKYTQPLRKKKKR